MGKKKVLIGDIARQLNVSITTVSFVLNGKAQEKRISDDVAARVLKLVDELGYKPNQLAKNLREGKTRIIGLIVEDISNPFFATVARHIEEQAFQRGYKIIYCSTDHDTAKTKELIAMFRDWHVDGYIITPPAGIEAEVQALLHDKLPVVLFDRYLPSLPTSYVGVDNFGGMRAATEHLLAQGYQRIAYCTIASDQSQMAARLGGYETVMTAHGRLPLVLRTAFPESPPDTIRQIGRFLTEQAADAVIFATNYLGRHGLEALAQLGRRIPHDLAVVAFDDHDLFRLYSPGITALAQPVEDIARELIHLLLTDLNTRGLVPRRTVELPVELLVRASTLPAATVMTNGQEATQPA